MSRVMVRLRRAGIAVVGFYAMVVGLGAWSVAQIAAVPGQADWTVFSILLVLACGATRLRLELPATDRSASLAFLFSFAAIIKQPPLHAFAIVAAVELCEGLLTSGGRLRERRNSLTELGFQLGVAATGVYAASGFYNAIGDSPGYSWGLGGGLAAATYFAVFSGLTSIRRGLQQSTEPWKIWNRTFFWRSPIYLLAPLGLVISEILLEADSIAETLLGLVVIAAAFLYLYAYFPRLRDRQAEAEKLAEIRQRALETLAVAIEAKDGSTAGHLQRVKMLAARLATRLHCNPEELRTLQLAAVLHDVGKVGVPDYILQKPSRLTEGEFQEITAHAAIGAGIVSAMDFPEPVDEVVLSHHEHWDGSGYPRGLEGAAIPRLARMLTVVDCFDALVSERPYRAALPIEQALEMMGRQRGRIFDPEILDAFIKELPLSMSAIEEINRQLGASEEPAALSKVRQTWFERPPDGRDPELAARADDLQRLSRRPDHLVAFHDVHNALVADVQYDRPFRQALSRLKDVSGADIAALFMYSSRRRVYTLETGIGLPAEVEGELSLGELSGLSARAVESGAPQLADEQPFEIESDANPFAGSRSSLVAPLLLNGRAVGLLVFASRRDNVFEKDQILLLSLLSQKLAATLVASHQLRKIHIEANTDPVTSLPNPKASLRRLEQEINRAEREKQTLGVLFMDLNGLKPINDSYGHAAGDRLLAATAAKLRKSLRNYDFVGRVGGDEFLAVLPGISSESLRHTVENLKRSVAESPVELGDGALARPLISVGASLYPVDGTDRSELVDLADERMYEDKERFRNSPPAPEPAIVEQANAAAQAG